MRILPKNTRLMKKFFLWLIAILIVLAAAVAITVFSLIFAVSTPKLILAIIAMCIAVFQHRGNIRRLIAGEERRIDIGELLQKLLKKGDSFLLLLF